MGWTGVPAPCGIKGCGALEPRHCTPQRPPKRLTIDEKGPLHMPKRRKPPTMSTRAFAALKGVSRQAVAAAIERGDIPPTCVGWQGKGRRRVRVVTNVELAAKSWTPTTSEQPSPSSDDAKLSESTSMADAKRLLVVARAKRAQLDFEVAAGRLIAVDDVREKFDRIVLEARNAFLTLARRARSRIPSLTVADGIVLDTMVREVLTDLAEGPKTKGARRGRRRKGTDATQRS